MGSDPGGTDNVKPLDLNSVFNLSNSLRFFQPGLGPIRGMGIEDDKKFKNQDDQIRQDQDNTNDDDERMS